MQARDDWNNLSKTIIKAGIPCQEVSDADLSEIRDKLGGQSAVETNQTSGNRVFKVPFEHALDQVRRRGAAVVKVGVKKRLISFKIEF